MAREKSTPAAVDTAAGGKVFRFEGVGFADTRKQLEQLVARPRIQQRLWKEVKDLAAEHDFTAVAKLDDVEVSEDDGQEDTDIKVFVSVKLIGTSRLRESASVPRELDKVLNSLAEAICCDRSGCQLVFPDDWELVSID